MLTKKILNKDLSTLIEEMVLGFTGAYFNDYEKIEGYNAIKYKHNRKNKVALVIGGGSGHEPLFSGFCGAGLADAVACGNICASPNPELILHTALSVDQGKGVLFIYGSYAGDNLNFDMAEEFCSFEGIKTANIRVWDDIASAPRERIEDRRGIAGDIFVIKIAGAACDMGLSLEEVVDIVKEARDSIASIGLAVSSSILPGNIHPTFELGDDEIEFGMGLHGEAGIERTTMKPADKLVERMYSELRQDMNLTRNDEVAILVNGLGGTPLIELYVVFNELRKLIELDGVILHDAEVKTYCTCMDMGGFSITILRLNDRLKEFYNRSCYSPYYCKLEDKEN